MKIITLPVGDIYANCYIIKDSMKNCVIIDPGDESEKIKQTVEDEDINKVYTIFLTHGHYDHCGVIKSLSEHYKCGVYINRDDEKLYKSFERLIQNITGEELISNFLYFKDSEKIEFSDELTFKIIFTPGHSKGCVCIELLNQKVLFTGDTLFKNSIGRTDLPGGSLAEIKKSLKILTSDYSGFKVYPGHGPTTSIEHEKQNNQYLK